MTPRFLFPAIVALEAAHTGTAILLHRVPAGHDGFQYFTLQYFFLNNAIQSGEVAQWIPYMTHGTVAALWYGIQGSFLQTILLQAPALLREADLLTVHHLGVFVDEMVLLTGVWLLARRFFTPWATFFVAVSVMGSCVWLDQPYWNFRLYYAVPLVLEMAHRFLETGRWRWAFLSANLLALQTIGNLPYLIPFVSFSVFAYVAFYAALQGRIVWDRLRASLRQRQAVPALLFGALSFAAAYGAVTIGTGQLVGYNWGRNADSTTSLEGFLTFAGMTDAGKWIDVVFRVSPFLDNTLYAGILLVPLLLSGLIFADRRRLHLVLVAATLLLFTLATPLTTALYYVWPGMPYFRHVGLVSSLVKVFFCFVAGIGFERLFEPRPGERTRLLNAVAAAGALLLVAGAVRAVAIAGSPRAVERYVAGITAAPVVRPLHVSDPERLAERLRSGAAWALTGAAFIALAPSLLRRPRSTMPGVRRGVLWAALAFVAIDVYQFKFAYLIDRSDSVGPESRFVARPSPLPYAPRRLVDLHQARAEGSPRLAGTLEFSRLLRRRFEGQGQNGAQYWTNNAFWFVDEIDSTFQADSWLAPLDELARSFRDADAVSFPVDRAAASKLGGLTADKIRFFARAHTVDPPDGLAALLSDTSFEGDLLFVAPPPGASGRGSTTPWAHGQPLSADDSRPAAHRVERFDANNLVVTVSNPAPEPLWMFYADVWHPSWRATVNGRPVPVYRANIAYKAIVLEPGDNVVHFRFSSTLFLALSAAGAANAALWLLAVGWMMIRLSREPEIREQGPATRG